MAALLIAATVVLAYHNSLTGPLIFDDRIHIAENPHIQHLWPLSSTLADTDRPVVILSLALNYAVGRLRVTGYHATNIAIHLLAALTLFAILRLTFAGPRLGARYASSSTGLGLIATALWAAHPLNTQAVTYVIQRGESLSGLSYLLTLYATIRGASSARRSAGWYALAVVSCALGAACKAVVVSAPLVVLLYDRFFLARTFREALRRRWALYAGLAGSWGVLIALAIATPDLGSGFHATAVTPLGYAASQPGVVMHYLGLAFWPHPLVLDYGWPVARSAAAIVVPGFALAGMAGATLWAAARFRPIAFLGSWFFLVLGPSSSLFPINDLAFEHRMYLPLAAVIVLLVLAGDAWMVRRARLRGIAIALVILAVIGACALTIRRNADYRSEIAIWNDVATKRPANPRGHNNLGRAFLRVKEPGRAIPPLLMALRLDPNYAEARNNLGTALATQGEFGPAVVQFRRALELKPALQDARFNLGRALVRESRSEEAIGPLAELLRARPHDALAWNELGNALAQLGRFAEAEPCYRQAVSAKPGFAEAQNNLGIVLVRQGRVEDGIVYFRAALQARPDFAPARRNLGNALARVGRAAEVAPDLAPAIGR